MDQSLSHQRIQSTIERCNAMLESKILQTLSTKRHTLHHPNESVVHVREPWSSNSTLPGLERRQITSEISEFGQSMATKERDEVPSTDMADDHLSSEAACEERDVKSGETSAGAMTPNQITTEMQRSISPIGPAVISLSQGDTVCHRLTRVCDTLIVRTERISLHASWDWNPTASPERDFGSFLLPDDCWVQVKWLSPDEHIKNDTQNADLIECENSSNPGQPQERVLESGAALSQKALFIENRGHVLMIQFHLDNPQHD